ncbi:MAG: helix-turn-helix domain-containing protein [Candidatus Symbiothrix sp.]|jgi:transcriptional regulator with XRE-family HTH domain|nr:helix-turn-helix domain-containing protein [Candidatus Symbiothrix sp.]
MNVVENIINIRKEKGISQEFIANALHVDASVISNIERGKRELKVCELVIIAKALGVDVLYLLTYPHVYVKKELNGKSEPAEAILQIKLAGEKRDKILKLLFGEANLEFLNE